MDNSPTERIYQVLTADEEDARTSKGVSEEACQVVPGNFLLLLASLFFSKLADALVSAKVVLPWLLSSVSAPIFFNGLLVPIRESGSLIPQLVLGGVIRRFARRKWFYVLGSVLQALAVSGMVIVALVTQGLPAGTLITLLLIMFRLARGMCSVASKDVLGKTVPKQRRGRLNGYSASLAGLIALGVGAAFYWDWYPNGSLAGLLILGAVCWLMSGVTSSQIDEYAGATEGAGHAFKKALKSLSLLQSDANFRHFVLVRSLMMSSALVAPYLVILAQPAGQSAELQSLGLFILAAGLASVISGPFWGRMADMSSRRLMLLTAVATTLICLSSLALLWRQGYLGLYWGMGLFFLLSIIHEGVRLGRKTYIVDMAEGNRRTEYVSVSNTLIGFLLLVVGALGAVIAQLSELWMFAGFAMASGTAAILSLKMREV